MGGLEPSHTYVEQLIKQGVHIVTANKDLIAEFGDSLHKTALIKMFN